MYIHSLAYIGFMTTGEDKKGKIVPVLNAMKKYGEVGYSSTILDLST
jgi:hypothetical protein